MKVQINVFTESQVKFLEALLNDSGFEDILSEDWNVADEYIPKNFIFAELSNNNDIDWETFGYNINMILPGFMFQSEETDDGTLIFTTYPTWAEGRELTREEFLSLFPEDYKKEMLEAEKENYKFNSSLETHKSFMGISFEMMVALCKINPEVAFELKKSYKNNLLDTSGNAVKEGHRYKLGEKIVRIVSTTLFTSSLLKAFDDLWFEIIVENSDLDQETLIVKSQSLSNIIPIYQTNLTRTEG
jgi:hypothetical protein